MQYDLKTIFKTLGWPLGMVGVIIAVLIWIGLTPEQLITVALSLVGLQLMQAFIIDVLKYVGVVDDGTAGKWSAVFNLLTLGLVVVWLKFFPLFDIYALDKQLLELAKLLMLIFAYVTQIIGTRQMHKAAVLAGVGVTFR